MFRGRRGGDGRGNLGVMLLFFQLMNYGFDRIPPVTLVAIIGQAAIFLGLGDIMRYFPSSSDVCISTYFVVNRRQWSRLILGSLYHASDMHLYFNMVSMLWKGSMLERKFKSVYFAYLLAVFTVLTSLTYVAINYILTEVMDESYILQCAVGFSGVLFALKVLATHYTPGGQHYALGFIPVPSKYIYWAELILIQVVYPRASFTGHLAGILVGLLYIKGPLKAIMDSFLPAGPSYTYTAQTADGRRPRTQGYTTGGQDYNSSQRAPEDNRYYDYTGGLSEEEQLQRATEESRQDSGARQSGSQRLYPDLDELRRRRADRYT